MIYANLSTNEQVETIESEAFDLINDWELSSLRKAVVLFETAANDWENLGQPQKSVKCLFETAKAAQITADYQTAFRALEKALKLSENHRLDTEKIILLSYYSLLSQQKGLKQKAAEYSRKALNSSKQNNSDRARSYAFFSAGIYEYFYGKIDRAFEYFEQAESFARRTDDTFIITQILSYIGYSYLREGTAYKAAAKMDFVLSLCEKKQYRKGIALAYLGKGYISYFLNEKQSSLDYFHKSFSLFPPDFEWLEKARTVQAIGLIHKDFTENESAIFYFQQAADFFEKADYPLGKLTSLTFLAETYLADSQTDKARQIYESAKIIARKTGDDFGLATVIEGIGNLDFHEKKFDSAISNYKEALKTYDAAGVKLPIVENLIGTAFFEKKDYISARKFFESALQTNIRTEDHQLLSENFFNLSKLDLIESNHAKALENIGRSVELTDALYSDVANTKLKRNYLSNVFERYQLYIKLLMGSSQNSSNKDFIQKALQVSEKARARSFLESLTLSDADLTKDADAESIRRENEIRTILNSKADKLTDLLSQNSEKTEIDRLSVEINELENELENLKAKLKQQSPLYSEVKNPSPFDVREFQQTVLDENSVLLEFSFGNDESYLWMIGKNSLDSYILPPRSELEEHIEKLLELFASREMKSDERLEDFQKRIAEAENLYQDESTALSRRLFGQIADKIQNKRLIIVPDGKLHYFPVAALPLPNSESNEPFLTTNEIVYAPSAQTLLLLEKSKRQPSETAKNLLIFSDPVFTADDTRISELSRPDKSAETVKYESFRFVESLNSLQRLTASKNESDSILDIIGASNADSFSGFGASREQLLKTNTENYKIIHFATHGKTDEKHPELSGIILSRFDEQGQKLNEFIRIHDIYGLKLNTDLVVLSACETGVGKEVKGEGLMSLNNAFLQSGSKTVMASLWKVEDNATQQLMKSFYRGMVDEKLTPSQSLRQAQIELRKNSQFKSPFYWAAFTVQGDFRNVPKISKSFGNQMYLFSLIPIIMVGFYIFRKRKIFLRRSS